MKTKNILTLLSVLIIFFCIDPIFVIIDHIDLIIDDYNGYIALFVLFYSIILSMLTLILVRLEKFLFFQILLSTAIFGLNLGISIYFTIIIRVFWINTLIGLTEFKLASIVSISCSILIVLLSYFQIKSKKHMKFSIEDLKTKIKLFYLRLGTLVAYIPIIAGILYSMTAMPALAYISWNIFSLWPGINVMASWIFHDDYSTNFPIDTLLWIELVIFICGFGLFLHGLIHLVKAKKEKIDIVQTGLYKYIRHPQNLGIIIFSFPFCLYVPFLGDAGLKVGDIFSWTLFFLLIIIYSDIEEIHMVKRYPDDYKLYRSNTGFFIPRIIKTKKEKANLEINDYLFRWLFLIGGYILLISILDFIFSKFPLLLLRYYH
ncbi:MAG: methyltransferase family protein [Promethearchaeota archaeon]